MPRLIAPPLLSGASTFGARAGSHLRILQFSGRCFRELARRDSRSFTTGCGVIMASSDPSEASGAQPAFHSASVALATGEMVKISGDSGLSSSEFSNAIGSSLFKNWLKNMESDSGILSRGQMSLKHVHIQGLDMFGSKVGFLKFKADVLDNETDQKVPGIVFARGPAVSVLIILNSGGEDYVVLTEQARVPVGRLILELPAGMVDNDGDDIVGTAIREVEEETGISLNLSDMVNLTAFLHPSTGCKIFPSPGGCDEEISLFLYKGHVDVDVIRELSGKQMGLRDHGEMIKVHVIPYRDLWRMTPDSKVLSGLALYEMANRDGLLPS